MKSKKLLTLLAAAGMASAANAAVFLNTFDSGTDGWYIDQDTNDEPLLVVPTNNLPTTNSGLITWGSGNTNTNHVIGKSFADTTLAVGQTLRFTADVTLVNNQIFRFGLYNFGDTTITSNNWGQTPTTGVAGYYTFFRDNASTQVQRYEVANTGNVGGATTEAMGSSTTIYDFNNTTTYSILYDVTLTSAGRVDTFASLSNGTTVVNSVSGFTTTTANIVTTFDTVVFRGKAGNYTMDNAKLELIGVPEPRAALLGGLGLLALLRRRRG